MDINNSESLVFLHALAAGGTNNNQLFTRIEVVMSLTRKGPTSAEKIFFGMLYHVSGVR